MDKLTRGMRKMGAVLCERWLRSGMKRNETESKINKVLTGLCGITLGFGGIY